MSLLTHVRYHSFKILNRMLAPVDRHFYPKNNMTMAIINSKQPLFIIGPPRSGTTLLYQIIVSSRQVGYMNNFIADLYGCPILAARLYRLIGRNRRGIKFVSRRGITPGISGPHEFGEFWYRWFPRRPQYSDESTVSAKQQEEMRKIIAGLTEYLAKPVLFKNVVHSVRIKALLRIFPGALFIVVKRDPVYVAQSIYLIRKGIGSSEWWSVQPREIDSISSRPLLQQAVYQVYHITRQIEQDAAATRPEQFISVSYEDFCANPLAVMHDLDTFWNNHGLAIGRREIDLSPFGTNNEQRVLESEFDEIRELVSQLWP